MKNNLAYFISLLLVDYKILNVVMHNRKYFKIGKLILNEQPPELILVRIPSLISHLLAICFMPNREEIVHNA